MRSQILVVSLLAFGSSCRSITAGNHVSPVAASWMEWPAEVGAATPFEVRIVGFTGPCGSAYVRRFEIDMSVPAIVFTPYAVVPDKPPCDNVVAPMFDDTVPIPALLPGTYDLRSGSRVFGQVVVKSDPVSGSRLNAAGRAGPERDQTQCLRLRPVVFPAVRLLLLENAPDTPSWMGFVSGHITDLTVPTCGETRVFHLESLTTL